MFIITLNGVKTGDTPPYIKMEKHKFHHELKEMLRDERKAPRDYMKLKSLAHTKGEKKVISGIIKDERSHYSKLSKMNSHCKRKHY